MDAIWDVLTGAVLLGWFTTALFGAVAGAAVAVWARVNVLVGIAVGSLTVFAGIAVLLVIGVVRAVKRRREQAGAPVGVAAPTAAASASASGRGARSALAAGGTRVLPAAAAEAPPAWSFAPPAAASSASTRAGATDDWFGESASNAALSSTVGSSRVGSGSFAWGSATPGHATPGAAAAARTGSYPDTTGAGDPFGGWPRSGEVWTATTGADLLPAGTSLPTVPAGRRAPASVRARVTGGLAARVQRPSWPAIAVSTVSVLVAAGFAVTSQLTWVSVRGLDGSEIFSVGPFGLQLGAFVAAASVVAGVSGVGVLLWRSAWWPVLSAWFATWWIFVAIEALSVSDSLSALNRFVQSMVSDHAGYRENAAVLFGDAWTYVLAAAVALFGVSVALVVLQHRGTTRRAG